MPWIYYIYGKNYVELPLGSSMIVQSFSINIYTAISGTLCRLAFDWIDLRIKSERLQKENLQSELKLLKNQISPHFFFNTLNNIDSLIKSDTEKASETLVKLSSIMRYMIYDTKVSKVPLINEIKRVASGFNPNNLKPKIKCEHYYHFY